VRPAIGRDAEPGRRRSWIGEPASPSCVGAGCNSRPMTPAAGVT